MGIARTISDGCVEGVENATPNSCDPGDPGVSCSIAPDGLDIYVAESTPIASFWECVNCVEPPCVCEELLGISNDGSPSPSTSPACMCGWLCG